MILVEIRLKVVPPIVNVVNILIFMFLFIVGNLRDIFIINIEL